MSGSSRLFGNQAMSPSRSATQPLGHHVERIGKSVPMHLSQQAAADPPSAGRSMSIHTVGARPKTRAKPPDSPPLTYVHGHGTK